MQIADGLSERACRTLAQAMQQNWKLPGMIYCYFNTVHRYYKIVLAIDILEYQKLDGPPLSKFCGQQQVTIHKAQLKDEAAHLPVDDRPYNQVYEILTLTPPSLHALAKALKAEKTLDRLMREPEAFAMEVKRDDEHSAPVITLEFPTKDAAKAALKMLPKRFHHLVQLEAGV